MVKPYLSKKIIQHNNNIVTDIELKGKAPGAGTFLVPTPAANIVIGIIFSK